MRVVVLAALVVALIGASLAPAEPRRPRVLVTVGQLEAFGQDGPRIAWADTSNVTFGDVKRCDGVVKERDLRTGRIWNVFRGNRAVCGQLAYSRGYQHGRFQYDLAVAGERVLSSFVSLRGSSYHAELRLGMPGARQRGVGSQHIAGGRSGEAPFVPVPLAGDGRTLVYANISGEEETYGYGYVHRAGGGRLAGTWGTRAVAASGDAFAAARVDVGGCVCNSVVAVSPDGSRLVVRTQTGPRSTGADTTTTAVIRTDDGRVESVLPKSLLRAQWSPDGARLAVDLLGEWIAIVDVATGSVRRLALGYQPTWSPDGALLAFVAYRRAAPHVVVAASSGGTPRDLGVARSIVSWSPDGSQLLVVRSGDIYALDVARATARLVARDVFVARASPDGRQIAFSRTTDGDGGLFLAAVSDGRERRLGPSVLDFSWSPDSRRIASLSELPSTLTLLAADGSSIVEVGPALDVGEWSPDGSRIAFVSRRAPTAPYLVEVAVPGEPPRVVTRGTFPTWSRDGQRLLVQDHEGEVPITRVVSVDAGTEAARREAASEGWLPGRDRVLLRLSRSGELAVAAPDLAAPVQLTHTVPAPPWKGVEVRDARSGKIRWRFPTAEAPVAVALDGPRVAVLLGRGKARRIEVLRGAAVIRSITVSSGVTRVSLSGRWIVYLSRGAIRAVDVTSARETILARPRGTVVGLSIDGTRVAWGEQRRGPDTILAVDLPA